MSIANRIKKRAITAGIEAFFQAGSRSFRLHPFAKEDDLVIVRDVPYLPTRSRFHLLDITKARGAHGPLPVAIYVHGGGFKILSKETHWMFVNTFAREGYLVFNINYRLGAFPQAPEDVAAAIEWVFANCRSYGGDPTRVVIAGESAGANLSLASMVGAYFDRPEPWTQRLRGLRFRAVVPMCGLLEVARPERFWPHGNPTFLQTRIEGVCSSYVGTATYEEAPLASPLRILESDALPNAPLPPIFSSVGTKDPVYEDTERLERVLNRRNVPHLVTYHPGRQHAFQAAFYDAEVKHHWRACFDFLKPFVHRSETPSPPLHGHGTSKSA